MCWGRGGVVGKALGKWVPGEVERDRYVGLGSMKVGRCGVGKFVAGCVTGRVSLGWVLVVSRVDRVRVWGY